MPVLLQDVRSLEPAARHDLLALNNAHAVELSVLTMAQFCRLIDASWLAWSTAERTALFLAFDQDAVYDSPNFQWFRDRYRRFVYIDRIVVAPAARGQGIARAIYHAALQKAAADGRAPICCEVNCDPPNPASDAFHAALGFQPAGQAVLPNGKTVRYLTLNR